MRSAPAGRRRSQRRSIACPPSRAHLLTDAIAKIHQNRRELLATHPTA